ncbi:hypothetical protein CYY_002666 [Polysphondylium violaceum]|uniref:AP-3 complex subunit beta n=1 Tax=Polysphondylium violaceum TaxID=133409 RepID=A0A8J4UUW8_9MYCE|nr:hypothetical protein CYY_002666 [Polysphondylium violaceum]
MNTVLNNISQSRYFTDTATNTKIEEIKKQLDGPSDAQKIEAMKKLIAMLSKGRDVSEAFPAVVKNVISKNLELKKLVYMYLVHYSEIQHNSALLSINTIHKSLYDQNQVIRATSLRVMSSIRVVEIVEVIVMAIEKCLKDSSPFVRKAAAFAISKVCLLDSDKQEAMIEYLDVLLNDNSIMVLGAAMVTFSEICPDRFDLLHQHYRKICQLLADFDEWSQAVTLGVLMKYARTQFKSPDSSIDDRDSNKKQKKKSTSFYSDDEDEDDSVSISKHSFNSMDNEEIDPDHRLLLKSTLPLLQSRNNAVVMAVSSLYFYCAPVIEAQKVGKSLVRLLRNSPEAQYIVLTNIATMVTMRPNMFEPFLSEFFITSGDPEYCIKLKLEILTRLATPSNISRILKEFKEYVKNEDKIFVAATIHSIGTCATNIPDVTESCIYGLVSLLSNPSSVVVAESVVVLKRLLQMNAKEGNTSNIKYENIILHLGKLLDTLQVANARASIIWVIGEYSYKVPLVAPDILRKLAKSFSDEDDSVKLQILVLGSKLYFQFNNDNDSNSNNRKVFEKVTLLFQYVLNQAKFDLNYDVRDNSRMLRHLLFSSDDQQKPAQLLTHARQIVINEKPVPTETSISEDRQRFILGSLSHIVNHSALGYQSLPSFPEQAPDPSVRQPIQKWVAPNMMNEKKIIFGNNPNNDASFYSDDEQEDDEDYQDYEEYDDDENEEQEEEEEEDQDELEKFFDDSPKKKKKPTKKAAKGRIYQGEQSEDDNNGDDEDDMDELFGLKPSNKSANGNGQENLMELINVLDSESLYSNISTTSIKKVLLKQNTSGGLGIEYCFVRGAYQPTQPSYNIIQLYLKNHSDEPITDISIGTKNLIDGADILEFETIDSIDSQQVVEKQMEIKFNSTSQSLKFEILSNKGSNQVSILPIIGELVIPTLEINSLQEDWCHGDNVEKQQDEIEMGDSTIVKIQDGGLDSVLLYILESVNLKPIAINQLKSIAYLAGTTLIKNEPLYVEISKISNNNTNLLCVIKCNDTLVLQNLFKKLRDILTK